MRAAAGAAAWSGTTGEPALLCLPGWCGDRTVFEPLLPLTGAGRRTIAADLPDHGGSEVMGDDFDTADVVDAMVDVVRRLGIARVVPLALSHAGWMAIEMRRRLGPERVPAIVLMDWMVLGPPPGFLEALAGLQQEASWRAVRAELFDMWTSGLDIPELHRYVAAMGTYGRRHWGRAGREIASAFAAEGSPLAALDRLETPCPTLHVYAQPAADALLAAQQAYAAEHPWFSVRRLDARSHFPTFEVPEQIATAVEEFLCRTV